MPQTPNPTPNTELINQIQNGKNLQARMQTWARGFLKGAQIAHQQGGDVFNTWVKEQTGLIDNYCQVVTEGSTGAGGQAQQTA